MTMPTELPALAEGISREFLLWHRICPLDRAADGRLRVATAPGASPEGLDDLAIVYGAEVLAVETRSEEHTSELQSPI